MNFYLGRSLFIFSPKNRIRIVCRKILKYFAIQDFILCMVVGSCIALSLKDPFASPDSEINLGLRQIEIFFFIFFLFEFIIKLVAFGFLWNGSNSCLRNFEGLIDFFILLLNVYEFSNGLSSNFKALRMLKFFFIGPYRRSLKIVIKTVLLSFPNLMKIGIITVYIMFFFSFFAVKVLKNRFYVCENVNLKEYNLQTKYDCLDYGGDWIKKDFTYDNIAAGIFRLFAICNTEGWTALS